MVNDLIMIALGVVLTLVGFNVLRFHPRSKPERKVRAARLLQILGILVNIVGGLLLVAGQ